VSSDFLSISCQLGRDILTLSGDGLADASDPWSASRFLVGEWAGERAFDNDAHIIHCTANFLRIRTVFKPNGQRRRYGKQTMESQTLDGFNSSPLAYSPVLSAECLKSLTRLSKIKKPGLLSSAWIAEDRHPQCQNTSANPERLFC
jgi:hypothetical protein